MSDSKICVIRESFGCCKNTEKIHFTYFIGFWPYSLEIWRYSLGAKVLLSGTNAKQQEWRKKGHEARKKERHYQEGLNLTVKLSWLSGHVIYLLARPCETYHLLEQCNILSLIGQSSLNLSRCWHNPWAEAREARSHAMPCDVASHLSLDMAEWATPSMVVVGTDLGFQTVAPTAVEKPFTQ